MRKLSIVLTLCLVQWNVFSQTYPFQDTKLDDEKRLDNLISLMTLDEKINCLSTKPSVTRLGISETHIMEGLHGLQMCPSAARSEDSKKESFTSIFPQAIGLAQMWDPEMLSQLSSLEATEARYLAQSKKYGMAGLILLAPLGDLGRDIRWGRTEECYGEDAFLTSTLVMAFIKGLQGNDSKYWKIASLMKHFVGLSNENNRLINSIDFDARLFREYYSYPFFKGIVEGGSRAFMATYHKLNGIPCSVHPMLKDIAIKEWGQNGIISTDGGAFKLLVTAQKYYPDLTSAATACIKSGITMFLDDFKEPLIDAVNKKLVTEQEINSAARGTLRVMLKLGMLDQSPDNPYAQIGIVDTIDPWTKPENHELVRKATAKSVVLLKNENNILPIQKNKVKSIAVIGPRADMLIADWYSGKRPYTVTILQGIKNAVGNDVEIYFASSNKADSAVIAAKKADIAIVCVGSHPTGYDLPWGINYVASDGREDVDRQALSLEQEDLVKLVNAANPKTVMVLVSGYPYAINWSKEHIPAILHITHSSQELGNGLADVIFGKISPAGRLVQTWSGSIDELLPILDYNIRNGRTYMYDKHTPLFPFGYGLSYTTFVYSDLKLEKQTIKDRENVNVTFKLKNTGNFDSDEVVQLYVSFPDSKVERPAKALKGFKRVFVSKGQTVEVILPIRANDLQYWDIAKNAFTLEKATVHFFIGTSSMDPKLTGDLTVK